MLGNPQYFVREEMIRLLSSLLLYLVIFVPIIFLSFLFTNWYLYSGFVSNQLKYNQMIQFLESPQKMKELSFAAGRKDVDGSIISDLQKYFNELYKLTKS